MDNTGQLINYIVQELKRGVPEASVRSALLQNGWPVGPVDRAFGILRQNEPVAANTTSVELPDITTPKAMAQPTALPGTTDSASNSRPPRPKLWRHALVGLALLALLGLAGVSIVSFLNKEEKQQPQKQTTASSDDRRRTALTGLADDLSDYYKKHGTYPLLSDINNPDFTKANGFDAARYQDPSWKEDNTTCKNDQGRAILLETRTEDCYGYRVTARNGGTCDGSAQKCTRVVLTATLQSGKPYIHALDRNQKENH